MGNREIILKRINGTLHDLNEDVTEENIEVEEVDSNDAEVLDVYRHSCAHLLAHAVTELYPDAQYGIGPAVENGFYYDFLVKDPFTPQDIQKISKRMKLLVRQNQKIVRKIWSRTEALEYFTGRNQTLKVELIQDKVEGNEVSVYAQGDFVDLCVGPHLPSTKYLKHFALLSVAAAYWKGDESSHSLQRIYGVVFPTAEQLDEYLGFLKEAQKRDHRKLGKDLDLFSSQDEVGAGLILWHPRGSIIRNEIENYWRSEHLRKGYELIYSPHVANLELWNTSGHTDFYSENMYKPIEFDNTTFQLKPMNCPFHIVVFKSRNRSYRDLPIRWGELGTVYRYERSGVLHGLLRVRGFTQDDAHIFCTKEQLEEEVIKLIDFSINMLNTFGFNDFDVFLSTRPRKYVGEVADWDLAENSLRTALEKSKVEYKVDPGEGVFYGPKIDIKVKDVLQRAWQCTTIQIDFNLPKRFKLKYVDSTGEIKQPIMIHRALLGSLERFFGILIEHYGGFFPLWLAPTQAIILPITEKNFSYAQSIQDQLKAAGLRSELDLRSEGVGKKIRDAELKKIPYIIIIGDEEEKNNDITYRIHRAGDKGKIQLPKFISGVSTIINNKGQHYEL